MRHIARVALVAALLVGGAVTAAAQRPTYTREVPARLLRQTTVSEDSALKVAQARLSAGTVKALELESENGRLIWSFAFSMPNRPGAYEVNVDAKTGALVGRVEHEMPAGRRADTGRTGTRPRP
jgi:uncharacterized membrane protein YkoI